MLKVTCCKTWQVAASVTIPRASRGHSGDGGRGRRRGSGKRKNPTGKPWALADTGSDYGLQRGDHVAAGRNEPRMKKAMAPSIFINYRRADSGYAVGRIYQCLVDSFGREAELEALDRAWGEARVRQAFQPDNPAAPSSPVHRTRLARWVTREPPVQESQGQ